MSLSGGSGGGTIPPFNPSVTVDATTTLGSGGTDDWWGRATIKRRPSDNALVLVYRRATNHAVNDGDLHIKFSDDDGATWSTEDQTLAAAAVTGFPMNPSTLTAGQDAGEGWLYLCPNGDLVLHMWRVDYSVSLGGTWQSRSTDGGETWSDSELVDFGGQADDTIVFATDDDFVVDRVIYAGARVYTGGADGIPSQSILISSDDNGATWTTVSIIMDDDEGDSPNFGGQEVGLEYVGNGTIVAMIRDNPHTKSFRRFSTDMGATWGTLTNVTSLVGIAGRQRVYTLNHLAGLPGWWKDPRLVMVGFVHQSSGDSQPRRSCVWFSPDRGTTWDGPHYVDSTDDDAGYGDLFGKADGSLGMVSYLGTLAAASLKQYDLSVTLAP